MAERLGVIALAPPRQRRPGHPRLPALPRLTFSELVLFGLGCFVIVLEAGGLQFVVPRNMLGPLLLMLSVPAAFELYRTRVDLPAVALANWPLFSLVGIAALSWTWALDPTLSLTRVMVLVASFTLAIYGAVLLSRRSLIDIIDVALSLAVGVSILLALFVPSIGRSPIITHHGDSWSGLFAHRQYFAECCSILILICLYRGAMTPRSWPFHLMRIAVVLGGLYMANSKTSLLACVMAVALFLVVRFLQAGRPKGRRISPRTARGVFLALVVLAPVTIAAAAPLVPTLVGREDNLSGRTRMWRYGFEIAEKRPWLGAGYHSFWGVSEVNYLIVRDRAWAFAEQEGNVDALGNGHNGYFDAYFELGVVGVAALAALIAGFANRIVRLLDGRTDPIVPLLASLFAYILADNASETVFLKYDTMVWPVVMMGFMLAGKLIAQRPAAARKVPAGPARATRFATFDPLPPQGRHQT